MKGFSKQRIQKTGNMSRVSVTIRPSPFPKSELLHIREDCGTLKRMCQKCKVKLFIIGQKRK